LITSLKYILFWKIFCWAQISISIEYHYIRAIETSLDQLRALLRNGIILKREIKKNIKIAKEATILKDMGIQCYISFERIVCHNFDTIIKFIVLFRL